MTPDSGPPLVDVGGFGAVDESADPGAYVAWMDHQRRRANHRVFDALGIEPGETVLDVGCGTGVDPYELAQLTNRTFGIDVSVRMARAAHERCAGTGAAIAVADGQCLPFSGASFDAVCSRAVLIHTADPARIVAEAARVLRPGGRAVFSEPDHGSHLVASPEQDILDRLLRHRRGQFRNALVGRSLPALATNEGFRLTSSWATPIVHNSLKSALAAGGPFGVAVDRAVDDGALSAEEARRYVESLDALDRRGAFLFAAVSITVVATR